MLAISTEKVNDPRETSVFPGAEGIPRPPNASGFRLTAVKGSSADSGMYMQHYPVFIFA
ncbi:MAG: hypothetical protein ABSH17_09105 [Syntrophobacteraceae bacterium]|jgi:hypothetical protein